MSGTPIGWYKWYPRDFLASSTVRKMSITGRGVYRELLDLQWEDGKVPSSYLEAISIIGCSDLEAKSFEPYFDTCFPDGINPKLDEQRQKSVSAIEAQRASGLKSAEAKKQGKSKVSPRKPQGKSNPTETETETDIKEKTTKRTVFVKPSLDEVCTFMTSEGFDGCIHAPEFMDFYQSNGWKAGRNPMADWQAAARGWCRRSKAQSVNGSGKPAKKELYHD